MASQHKPRRRRKIEDSTTLHADYGTIDIAHGEKKQRPAFPLVSFLWPAKGDLSLWVLLPLVLMITGLFRWTTGLWDYSGYQSPPMHGDFEAQRHWMEITTHLPMSEWYFHDLQWWGLDYPPLTAYHSWILGKVGNFIDPSWFALHISRKLDTYNLKVFMRATVFVSEYLTYVPAVVIFMRRYARLQGVNGWEASIALVAVLMQPSTILIDHGHFQYNTVMLGLALASMSSMLAGRHFWSCFFFVGALGFKQMALFYAPAVFAYLLGVCLTPRVNVARFVGITLTTVVCFALLYAPFLLGVLYDWYRGLPTFDHDPPPILLVLTDALSVYPDRTSWYHALALNLAQSVHRIFPFARGIFEDKVANLWCALHTFHKLHRYPPLTIQRAALAATLAGITPPCAILLLRPRRVLLPWSLAATSLAFFLCSYQVHEKNILLPLLPLTVLLGSDGGLLPAIRAWVGLANALAAWTMFPLLARDRLRAPYAVLALLWQYLLGLPPASLAAHRRGIPGALHPLVSAAHLALYAAMAAWHALEALVPPPKGKPDLWTVVNVLIGAAGLAVCYAWCVWELAVRSGIFGGGAGRDKGKGKGKAE